MKALKRISLIISLLGGLNWGLWGFFQFDFIAWLCNGNSTGSARTIYAIIGLASLWGINAICKCIFSQSSCCVKKK